MALTDQIIGAESGGNPNAANPNSSASGPGQFINSTWLATVRAHRPDIADGKSDADLLALKTDPNLSREMTAAYAADNQAYLAKNGLPVTPGTTYLAHFAGPQGAAKVLQADPNAPVSDILGTAVVKANPFLQGMTAQGLQAWAARKMGIASPTQGPQNNAQASQPAAPMPLPSAQPPIFAQQPSPPNPISMLAGMGSPSSGAQTPAVPTAPPIFVPQQQPIDLSGLRAALAARAPIFANLGKS